jgi:hypothetical protein
VNARAEHVDFQILRHESTGYAAARKQAGWIKSRVFDRSFRLTRRRDESGVGSKGSAAGTGGRGKAKGLQHTL